MKTDKVSKTEKLVTLISRPNGATQDELMRRLGWQRHTVRGFVSTVGSRFGLKIVSTKTENGLVYRWEREIVIPKYKEIHILRGMVVIY